MDLVIFSTSNFALWLVMFPQFDPTRKNGLTFGIAFGVFTVLLAYYYFRQSAPISWHSKAYQRSADSQAK